MKRLLLCFSLLFAVAAYGGAWPTDTISTTNVDSASDDPGAARADIYNAMTTIKSIISARSSASGVAPLDSSSLVPLANIPSTLTGKSADTLDGHDTSYFATSGANTNITSVALTGNSTMAGQLTIANLQSFAAKETGGTARNVAYMNGSNQLLFGATTNAMYFYSSAIPIWYNGTSSVSLVDLNSTQTLTSKTLTSPAINGGTINNAAIGGTTAFSGAVTSTKSCASGYTRITPNRCRRTTFPSVDGSLSSGAQPVSFAVTAPSGALTLILEVRSQLSDQNSNDTNNFVLVQSYNESGRTTVADKYLMGASGAAWGLFSGTSAENDVSEFGRILAPVISGSAYMQSNLGNTGASGNYRIVGYYD